MDVIGGKALAWAVHSLYFKRNDNGEALTGAPRQNNGLISLCLKIYWRKSVEKRFNAFREIEGNQEVFCNIVVAELLYRIII
ncbi:hypothetical protein F8M41_003953 [Gigaspora margarita]|uniref:Uncharacterized protein n=1 Tax=Gigaspora margarita TaxID=4874 RepID=A0A8H4A643_GIGMA|nr:hypothetical protein F8M41_003953 [Gigaspora margarita]